MKIFSVSEFIEHINSLVAVDVHVVEGEISGFNLSQGKWVFFDLKDEKNQAKVGCFAVAFKLKSVLEDGMKVRVVGMPKVHDKSGQFRINVEMVELVGEGALKRAYELLLKKLASEGLFAEERKRPIPRFPETIGIIASKDSAAYGDFMRILSNRWGGVKVILAHVAVQGMVAVPEIVDAFRVFNAAKIKPDVLVLIRGGGSLEDLQAFNSEEVARAIFSSKVPVIVGVGHERDETIADYVADLRASTPSNAAERVSPERREIAYALGSMTGVIVKSVEEIVGEKKNIIISFTGILQSYVKANLAKVESLFNVLKSLDPKAVLKRGYAMVRSGDMILKSAVQVSIGDELDIQLSKGMITGKVISKNLKS